LIIIIHEYNLYGVLVLCGLSLLMKMFVWVLKSQCISATDKADRFRF